MGTYLRAHKRLLLLGAVTAVVAAAPSPASAAPWHCEASALTGNLLGGKVALPSVKTSGGAQGCAAQKAGDGIGLPAPLSSVALIAQTAVKGDNPATQTVSAMGGIADLRVNPLPQLPIALPPIEIPAELSAVKVDIPAVALLPAQTITIDLRPAIDALLPNRNLPTADLLRVQGAVAYASAGCVGNAPKLAGASQVAGITVLGQELPVNQIVEKTLTLLDSGNIDPSNLDITGVTLPAGLSLDLPVVGPVLKTAIQQTLDSLPTISIPAALAQIKVTPGEQTRIGDLLIQRALHIQVGVLGQSILDTTVGEAMVAAGDVNCAPALECTKKSLVLVDVFPKGGRVQLLGAADRKYAGRTVSIVFEATGKVVAKAIVGMDGAFETTAPLPPAALRGGNRARYMAVLGKEKSMNLKLARRMIVESMTAKGGKVTIVGRVTGALAGGDSRDITVKRRVSCTKMETVGTFSPRSDGTFRIVFNAPADARTAVYRLSSEVLFREGSDKLFDTYTLPRAVNLLGK
jgi:hypothetical protein